MHRNDYTNATPQSEFTNGDPQVGTARSLLGAKWLNSVQRELVGPIEQVGIALNDADDKQLVASVQLHVSTIVALRAVPVPQLPAGRTVLIYVRGYSADGDGGGGVFRWQGNSNEADDAGLVIVPNTNPATGRWKRAFDGQINMLWFGAVGDGVTINTNAVTKFMAAGAGRELFTPSGDFRTGKLTVPANCKWTLAPGVIIRDAGALAANERIVNITNDNVRIVGYGAKIEGNRAAYDGFYSAQRHCVFIFGAQHVAIAGLECNNADGDGFYLGGGAGDPANDVVLRDVRGTSNMRQGCSIVSARKVRVVDAEFANTSGAVDGPCAGLDIEPNNAADVLEDIKIVRPRCTGNDGPGIEIFLANWNAVTNYVDVEIVEPYTSNNGVISVQGRFRPGIDINRVGSATPCRGRIKIVDAHCVDERRAGIHVYDWDINGPLVEIIRPMVVNPNQAQGNVSTINGGIILHNSTNFTTTPGNIRIVEPIVRDDDGFILAGTLAPYRFSGAWDDVTVTNPKWSYNGANPWSVDAAVKRLRITSETELIVAHAGGVAIVDGRYIGRTITNDGAVAQSTVSLPTAVVGWVTDFVLMESFAMRLDPQAGDRIMVTGSAAGKYIEASVRGSRVRLRCREAGFWDMENVVGAWTSEP